MSDAGRSPKNDGAITLSAESVTFAYGPTPAVGGVSCTMGAGQITAIVGPNGCGKTTLLKLLCGQLKPHRGAVMIGQGGDRKTRIHDLTPGDIARRLALVPQNTSVGFAYSVRQMVLMARWPTHARRGSGGIATALGFETADDHQLANEAMWAMDVHHLADRPITALSGGERQRVIIARALAQQTPAILLDEPTSALDLWHQLELLAHLKTLAQDQGKLVVVVTHDLNLALQYADRAIVMDGGRIVADGPPGSTLTPAVLEPVYRVKVEAVAGRLLGFARLI